MHTASPVPGGQGSLDSPAHAIQLSKMVSGKGHALLIRVDAAAAF